MYHFIPLKATGKFDKIHEKLSRSSPGEFINLQVQSKDGKAENGLSIVYPRLHIDKRTNYPTNFVRIGEAYLSKYGNSVIREFEATLFIMPDEYRGIKSVMNTVSESIDKNIFRSGSLKISGEGTVKQQVGFNFNDGFNVFDTSSKTISKSEGGEGSELPPPDPLIKEPETEIDKALSSLKEKSKEPDEPETPKESGGEKDIREMTSKVDSVIAALQAKSKPDKFSEITNTIDKALAKETSKIKYMKERRYNLSQLLDDKKRLNSISLKNLPKEEREEIKALKKDITDTIKKIRETTKELKSKLPEDKDEIAESAATELERISDTIPTAEGHAELKGDIKKHITEKYGNQFEEINREFVDQKNLTAMSADRAQTILKQDEGEEYDGAYITPNNPGMSTLNYLRQGGGLSFFDKITKPRMFPDELKATYGLSNYPSIIGYDHGYKVRHPLYNGI